MDRAHHQCLRGSHSDSYPNYLSLSAGLDLVREVPLFGGGEDVEHASRED